MRILGVLLLAGLLAGCMSTGRPIDAAAVAAVHPGQTRAEVVGLLGRPAGQGVESGGAEVLVWMHTKAKAKGASYIPVVGMFAGGADAVSDLVTVRLTNGVVESVRSGRTESESRFF